MEEIYKSILLGLFTMSLFVGSSIILNEDNKATTTEDELVTEKIKHTDVALMETLTIDYEGAAN